VVRLDAERALVQTLDFFPPVVDDPVWYGRIAAANALSDVYAMGGKPLTAMNIVGFPAVLPPSLLGEILRGGAEKVIEAGAILVGGHSVRDTEVKYGLSVTGIVHPDRIVTNAAARPGDVLVLTKPLGMGAITTAIKQDKVGDDVAEAACAQMATLNKDAAEAALAAGAKAATDVTGFGLMGHGRGIAEASRVTLELDHAAVPLFPGALALAEQKLVSGGAGRTRAFLGEQAEVAAAVPAALCDLCFDAETSGGLLIAVDPARADALVADLVRRRTPCAVVVGRVAERRGEVRIRLL
jgi:selenide,water dikinase